jgi:hypothetical protein
MQSSHAAGTVDVAFDDPNLISDAGLVPVVALAEQIGLPDLVTDHVTIHGAANSAGANPAAKWLRIAALGLVFVFRVPVRQVSFRHASRPAARANSRRVAGGCG